MFEFLHSFFASQWILTNYFSHRTVTTRSQTVCAHMYVCHVCVAELINTRRRFIGYIIKQISKYPSVKLHRSKASGILDISSMPSQKPIPFPQRGWEEENHNSHTKWIIAVQTLVGLQKRDKNFGNFNNCLPPKEHCYLLNILAKLKSIFYVVCNRQNISLKYLQAPPILYSDPPSTK